MKKIFIIDSEEPARKELAALLRNEDFEVDEVDNETEAKQQIALGRPDLVLLDLCQTGNICLELLRWIKEHFPDLDVIVVSSCGAIDCVVNTIKAGALNYVMKPVNTGELLDIIHKALQRHHDDDLRSLRREDEYYCYRVDEVVGVSRSMEDVLQRALKVTDIDSTILITGESGTGKELIARIIHNRSRQRQRKEFIAINCAAIPDEILESELFGYVRGAFTGAVATRRGLFEVADGGTLFMDEIGDTSPQFQSKLLRVIQEKEIRRLGDSVSHPVDVRIVAATNRDLQQMIREGSFREDLFYRLSVIEIAIPPLRERKEDIRPLIYYFLQEINKRLSTDVKGVSDKALSILNSYDWPGNVRELLNSLERAMVLSEHHILQPEDFPLALEHELKHTGQSSDEEIITLKEMERRYLLKAMKKYNNNQKLVARKLGIGYTTLWRKLRDQNGNDSD